MEDYETLASTLHGRIRATEKEYIICAAIHFAPFHEFEHQPKNISKGFVVAGRRHHNCFITVSILSNGIRFREIEQGFITSKDRFVNRKEAGVIAFEAGQTNELKTTLFSEDIY